MSKRFILICLFLCGILMLCACNGEDPVIDPNKINPWETTEPSLYFTLLDDGTYSVSAGDLIGAKEIVIPATYEGAAVTEIANGAFFEAVGLSKITIPDSVKVIGANAFGGCISLESFAWPSGVREIPANAFKDCAVLKEISIPSGVVSIGSNAFFGCSELVEVTVPEGVVSIGKEAFGACANLERLSLPSSLMVVGDNAFADDVEEAKRPLQYNVVDGDRYLGNAQNPCVVLVKVRASKAITSYTVKPETSVIYGSALRSYSKLTSVTLHENIGSIGTSAFLGCSKLTSIDIPASVTSVGAYAFYGCTNLESVTGFEGVVTIGASAFRNCKKLKSISVSSELDSVGTDAFTNCPLSLTEENDLRYLGNAENPYVMLYDTTDKTKSTYTINPRTRIVYTAAFAYCASLESISVPDGVHRMMDSVFWDCTALTSVKLPEQAISLGNHIFYNCSALKKLVIPNSVRSIGGSFLVGCSALEDLSIPFVGANAGSATNSHFGYLFGIANFDAQMGNTQIPKTLHTVRVTACENISTAAFSDCKNITVISLPATLRSIGKSAFGFCTGIQNVIVEDLAAWCNVVLANEQSNPLCFGAQLHTPEGKVKDLVIPEEVSVIRRYTFYNCDSIKTLTVGSGVRMIDSGAFAQCDALTTVTMSDGVEAMGNAVFEKCKKLSEVKLSEKLVNIGNSAFRDCKSLETIVIPEEVLGIGNYAFKGCSALISVEFEVRRGWYYSAKNFDVNGYDVSVRNKEENASLLVGDCSALYWYRQ